MDDDLRMLAAEEYLADIWIYRQKVERFLQAVDTCKARLYSIGFTDFTQTKIKSSSGKKGAHYENGLIKLESLQELYKNKFYIWKCKSIAPLVSIGKLQNVNHEYLLRSRYSSGKPWSDIQEKIGCKDIKEARNNALMELSYIMESEGRLEAYANKVLEGGTRR
ncbi:MAG: hypothetical protein IJ188_08970 [Clostridia bacterium]|nr:hypothetical protein [Clostridia bacterium]